MSRIGQKLLSLSRLDRRFVFLGMAVVFVATTVGLGAVVTSRFGTREKTPKPAPATTASLGSPPGETAG